VIAVAWIAVWNLSGILEYAPHASLWFPPAAMTFAVFRVMGLKGAPGILVAAVAVTFQTDLLYDHSRPFAVTAATGLLFFLTHGVSYYLAAAASIRLAGSSPARPTPRTVMAFLVVAPIAALLAALGGTMSLAVTSTVSTDVGWSIVFPWWIGDFAGLVTLGPFFIIALERVLEALRLPTAGVLEEYRRVRPASARKLPLLLKLGCNVSLATLAAAVARVSELPDAASFAVFFLVLPQMWIVHTEGAVRSCVGVAAVTSVLAALVRLLGLGDQILTYQFAVIIIAGTAYFSLSVPALFADNERLRQLLMVDSLTGATSRPFFIEEARREVERARRDRAPLSLVIFDLDEFKAINDRHGHRFGDLALATAVRRCLGELRAVDLLGRFGGEEFVALLPMASLDAAERTAERLRRAIEATPVIAGGARSSVTASFGVAQIALGEESFEMALDRADQALYEAKRAGRNRVRAG